MILSEDGEVIQIVRAQLDLKDLPRLLKVRDEGKTFKEGIELEKVALQLIKDDFPTGQTDEFVHRVCLWGGGDRLASRVKPKEDNISLSGIFRNAFALCLKDRVADAVQEVSQSVHYLGVSFASKQLRFLVPEKAVILDSVIRERLGYAENIAGYQNFLNDCSSILILARKCANLSEIIREQLRICDIEVALYLHLKENKAPR